MAYSPVDIINLQSDIEALKKLFASLVSLQNECLTLIDRVELFLNHYHDYAIDDLPTF